MYSPETGEPEPDWVKTERQQFLDFRDLNKDGKMDREEIGHWILPTDYDHAEVESKHLLIESDKDKVRIEPGTERKPERESTRIVLLLVDKEKRERWVSYRQSWMG